MINVQFTMSYHECPIDHLRSVNMSMPWLNFLVEHSNDITYHVDYCNISTNMKCVTVNFDLKEKYETLYRLKYLSYG